MRALITGGTGYVARHLARRLVADGAAVRLTRRSATTVGSVPLPGVEWVDVPDIGPDTEWQPALQGVDTVFHLAAVAHRLADSQAALEDEYERVNADGTRMLARSLVARGTPARLVFLSSIGAVCTTSEQVVDVHTVPRPDTGYGRSKLHAEQFLARECEGSAVEWCALRAPLVYGPGAPGNMRRLLSLAARGWPLPLARALARRSFIYIENLVDALVTCARHPAVVSRVLPVADEETVSVAELVTLVGQLRGKRARLLPLPLSWMTASARVIDAVRPGPADRNDRLAKSLQLLFGSLAIDTSELRHLTGWRPPHRLREGMAATVAAGENPPE